MTSILTDSNYKMIAYPSKSSRIVSILFSVHNLVIIKRNHFHLLMKANINLEVQCSSFGSKNNSSTVTTNRQKRFRLESCNIQLEMIFI